MSILTRAFSRPRLEERAITREQFDEVGLGAIFSGSASHTGRVVDTDTAITLLPVWACVRLLSQLVGSLPLSSFFVNGTKREALFNPPAWIETPNAEDTRMAFIQKVVHSLLLDGNAFLYMTRDEYGEAIELIPLNPRTVGIQRNAKTNRKEYLVSGIGGVLTEYDILHIPYLMRAGYDRGLNPLAAAREAVGLGLAIDEFGARFYSNGAHLSGVIELPQGLTPEDAAALRASWEATHSGLANSHRPAVLTGGAKWAALSVAPEDAQFLATRSANASALAAQLYGVPPHMIGETDKSTSWGTGIEAQFTGFLVTSLAPLLEIIEQGLSSVIRTRGQVKFVTDGLLRADAATRWQTYRTQVEMGAMTIDEVRAREDLPPLPAGEGGNTRWRPNGWIPLSETDNNGQGA